MAKKKIAGREYSENWGGKREGQGRPPKIENKRNRNIGIRVSEQELEMIKSKANEAGLGLTDFIVGLANDA